MSFSAEIRDFVAGFKAGSDVGGDIQDRKLKREAFEVERANKDRDFELDREKFATTKANADRNYALSERRQKAIEDKYVSDNTYREKRRAEDSNYRSEGLKLRKAEIEARRKLAYPDGAEIDEEGAEIEDVGGDTDELYGADDLVAEAEGEETQEFAEGGAVEEPEAAIPIPKPKPAREPVAPTVNREGKGDASVFFRDVKGVVRDVMDSAMADAQKKPAALDTEAPTKSQDRVSFATGQGAATPEEIKAIDAVIDPENTMGGPAKTAARLVHAYKFYMNKNEPEKAKRIATSILAHNKMASQTLGKLAQAAVEKGDLASASKLITDAYDEVPDGKSVEAQPTPRGTVLYKVNQDNRVLMNGEVSAQQLWQLAGGVASGKEFIKQMSNVAAGAEPASATSPEKSPKKGKNYVRYDDAVAEAAQATRGYESLVRQYNTMAANSVADEENPDPALEKLKGRIREMKKRRDAAMKTAQMVAAKTGRSSKVFTGDLKSAMATSASALPFEDVPEGEQPAPAALPAQEEEGIGAKLGRLGSAIEAATPQGVGRRVGNYIGNAIFGEGEAVPTAPAQPAPAAAAQPVPSKPIPPNVLANAKAAIAKGADPAAVAKRLQENGFDTRGL